MRSIPLVLTEKPIESPLIELMNRDDLKSYWNPAGNIQIHLFIYSSIHSLIYPFTHLSVILSKCYLIKLDSPLRDFKRMLFTHFPNNQLKIWICDSIQYINLKV